MFLDTLPPRDRRISRTVAEGAPPRDPVGDAAAEFVVELLDGLVVELSYARPGMPHVSQYDEPTQTAVADRAGPGDWRTKMIVNVAGAAAGLCADGPELPRELADLPTAAFRAADRIATASGLDGNRLPSPLRRALQASIVNEVLAGEIVRLSRGGPEPTDGQDLVGEIIEHLELISSMTVEGASLSHGVVLLPARSEAATERSYPTDFGLKRVPLLFDGRDSVLVVDTTGRAETEVSRSAALTRAGAASELDSFTDRLGRDGGSLVASVSRQRGALGFYLHTDDSIWVYSNGVPLLTQKAGRWRAFPMAALTTGIAELARSEVAGGLAVAAAVRLSLQGHGGIIGVVASGDDIATCVQPKDRTDVAVAHAVPESAIHDVLDMQELDVTSLVRVASIDGATVVDTAGRLLAYGAIVTSSRSTSEGARTAAARTLSEHAEVVVKISEDGPITLFHRGREAATLLG